MYRLVNVGEREQAENERERGTGKVKKIRGRIPGVVLPPLSAYSSTLVSHSRTQVDDGTSVLLDNLRGLLLFPVTGRNSCLSMANFEVSSFLLHNYVPMGTVEGVK